NGAPKKGRGRSSSGIWNSVGETLAFPFARTVTTAGATTFTTSAYESRPPVMVWKRGVFCAEAVVAVAAARGLCAAESAVVRQAAPATSATAASTANAAWPARWRRLINRSFMAGFPSFRSVSDPLDGTAPYRAVTGALH